MTVLFKFLPQCLVHSTQECYHCESRLCGVSNAFHFLNGETEAVNHELSKTTWPRIEFMFPGFHAIMLTTNLCFSPACIKPLPLLFLIKVRGGFKKIMVRNNLIEINLICCISSLKLIIFEINNNLCPISSSPRLELLDFLKKYKVLCSQ